MLIDAAISEKFGVVCHGPKGMEIIGDSRKIAIFNSEPTAEANWQKAVEFCQHGHLTIIHWRVVTDDDVQRARRALRTAGIPATVRKGHRSTRCIVTVSTKIPTNQQAVDAVMIPTGFHLYYEPANHLATRFYYGVMA